MAVTRIDTDTLLQLSRKHPVIDVRSEGEFAHAHFPGAVSMPLFNDEERKIVGTAYKKESKQKAVKIGLHLFGQRMVSIVETVEKLVEISHKEAGQAEKALIIYCWRGGMRSGGIGWLLDLYGFKVYTVNGGYKAFRRWSMRQLERDYPLRLIGGYTGSGKTEVLAEMKRLKQPVIDLEDIAKHKGSAFGSIGMPPQPSQEMFENLLAMELLNSGQNFVDNCKMTNDKEASDANSKLPLASIWIEDESQRIGLVNLPAVFYKMMRSKPVYFVDIPFEERLKHIMKGYGKGDKAELVKAVIRIQKRLGGLETKNAVNHLLEDNLAAAFAILLKYYDKQYFKSLQTRQDLQNQLCKLDCKTVNAAANARTIVNTQTEKVNA